MRARQKAMAPLARRCSVVAFLVGVAAVPVEGQSPVGSWLAFTGCWTPVDQTVESPPTLCVIPGEDRVSAEFVTVRGSEFVSREVARADGRPVDATQEGCEGTTTWRFSDDGHRVYHRSEHVCDDAVNRKGSGMMVMVNPTEWMDVSSVEVEGQVTPWVQHYRMATAEAAETAGYADLATEREMAVRAARMYSTAAPTIASIVEAGQMLHAETVQAWLVESAPDLNVNAEQLVRMADAGMVPEVIDVVVAVSHPRRFRLQEEDRTGGAIEQRGRVREGGRYGRLGSGYPRYYSPFGIGYYGYGYSPFRYGYSPYSYGYGGYGSGYGGYYGIGYRPVVVSVEPRVESSPGRLIQGRGYTRRSGDPPRGSATVGRDAGSSVGASSGGGSRGSSGRTARRRGGGS